jgi:signal peptidase II
MSESDPELSDLPGTNESEALPPGVLEEPPAPVRPSLRAVSSPPALQGPRPSYKFFGGLAAIALLADVFTKAWAELTFSEKHTPIILVENHLDFSLTYNRGGAWGLFQNASEMVRRPFFLCVSLAAVVFIVSLYSRLAPGQRALKWGLPLVLGGALGNLTDRVVRTSVVDFIDYRADWITRMNEGIATLFPAWNVTDHWPVFNVADICICCGVALMAIDMIGSKHPPAAVERAPAPAAGAG